jgi:hypothetical protein
MCLQPACGGQLSRPRVGSQVMTPEMSDLLRRQLYGFPAWTGPLSPKRSRLVDEDIVVPKSPSSPSPTPVRLLSSQHPLHSHSRKSSLLIAALVNATGSGSAKNPNFPPPPTLKIPHDIPSASASVADVSDADVGVSACAPMLAIDYLKQVWTRWKVRPYRNGCTMGCCSF